MNMVVFFIAVLLWSERNAKSEIDAEQYDMLTEVNMRFFMGIQIFIDIKTINDPLPNSEFDLLKLTE